MQSTTSKYIALFTTAICLLLLFPTFPVAHVSIYPHAPITARVVYPFFHTNVFHFLINAYGLLSLTFLYPSKPKQLLQAYLIAISYPATTIASLMPTDPTVGLSSIIFALLGLHACNSNSKLYFHLFILSQIALGFLLPHVNPIIHLYTYIVGIITSKLL